MKENFTSNQASLILLWKFAFKNFGGGAKQKRAKMGEMSVKFD